MEDFKLKATNPQQYDAPDLDWRIAGDVNDDSRLWFRSYLYPVLEDLNSKRVLDIGSGVGQLFQMLKEFGASDTHGLEPSKRNIEHSRKLYPDVKIHEGTLQSFISKDLFDVAIAIAVFEHIFDIKDAFSRVAKILNPRGSFYLVIGNKEFNTKSHFNSNNFMVKIDVQELDNGVVATKTIYSNATIYDIFRPLEMTLDAAEKAGFELKEKVDMNSSDSRPVFHVLVFQKI